MVLIGIIINIRIKINCKIYIIFTLIEKPVDLSKELNKKKK